MPELPAAKQQRLVKQFGLSEYEANVLIVDQEACNYFEQTRSIIDSNQVINWILRELMALVKEKSISWSELLIKPVHLAELIELVQTGAINNQVAVEVFNIIAESGRKPTEIVQEKGLEQIGSEEELAKIVLAIIEANPDVVADYRAGKDRLFGFFVGQAMKETKGKGNPKIINDLLKKHL
jgi:aspartyl-tRNA(Asn)/glutamyl-tRNA(Gln) amidotransferase subunit B